MKRVSALSGIVMAVCLLSGANGMQNPAPPAQAPLMLRMRFQKNGSYTMRILADQQITQSPQGQTVEMNQKIGMGFRLHVLDLHPTGGATVEVVYQSFLYKQSGGPGGAIEYDSSKPTAEIPPQANGFAALIGQKYTIEMSPDGKIGEIKGIDAMYAKKKLNLPDGPEKQQIEKTLKEQFGEKSLKASMEQMVNAYPDKPLSVGEFWTKHQVMSTGFPMILDTKYTLTARENGAAHLKIHSDIKSNPGAPPLVIGDNTMRYNLSGEQNGTMTINEGTGWVKKAVITQNVTGEITMSGAQELTWPISIKGTATISSE